MVQNIGGSAARELLSPAVLPSSWSASGLMAVEDINMQNYRGIGWFPSDAPAAAKWMNPGFVGPGVGLSPDDRYISYAIDASGRFEVWVERLGGGDRRQVSTEGGIETQWCARCDEVFYRNGNRILASRVKTAPALEVGPPRVAFVAEEFVDTPGKSFDVSADGSRAYYVRRTSPPARTQIHVVQNWLSEVKERARPTR